MFTVGGWASVAAPVTWVNYMTSVCKPLRIMGYETAFSLARGSGGWSDVSRTKGLGSVPGQGAYPGRQFDLRSGHMWGATN